jgi:predicted GNAT superfamily acetyltransferase
VDGTLYLKELIVAAEALGSGISTGLYVEAISMGVGSGKVDTVCSGLHAPENEGLCRFKSGLGFQVVQVPAVSVIPKPIGAYIRARRPGVYYRLTGKRVVTSS